MGDFDVFHKEKNNTNKEKVDCSDPKNRPRFIGGGYDKRWKKRVRC